MTLLIPFGLLAVVVILVIYALLTLYAWKRNRFNNPVAMVAVSGWAAILWLLAPWFYIYEPLRWSILLLLPTFFRGWRPYRNKWLMVLDSLLAILAGLILFFYWQGGRQPAEPAPLALTSPFHDSNYYAMQAGSNFLTNPFHRSNSNYDIAYAVDFAAKPSGRSGSLKLKPNLNDFAIYGDSVFAPCAGTVIRVMEGNPDNEPGNIRLQNGNRAGNAVFIEVEGTGSRKIVLLLAHLLPGSVHPKPGQVLKTGTFIGRVGNSGYSIEPHLHLSASWVKPDGTFVSVPLLFEGRFLNLHDGL